MAQVQAQQHKPGKAGRPVRTMIVKLKDVGGPTIYQGLYRGIQLLREQNQAAKAARKAIK